MSTADRASPRLVEQRLRNRAIEALATLAEADDGVRAVGAVEYAERFFDAIDDRAPWAWRTWSVFTGEEVAALAEVHDLLVAACAATQDLETDEDFLRSGWPNRIRPAARAALDIMELRGRFDEESEEDRPSR